MLDHTYKSHVFSADIFLENNKHYAKFRSEPFLRHFLKKIGAGQNITVTITNRKPKRTSSQNNYLWFYLNIIAQETGHTSEELHELFKGMFLTKELREIKIKGKSYQVRIKGSTTELSVGEFCEYILRIEAECGVPAPDTANYDLVPLRPTLV